MPSHNLPINNVVRRRKGQNVHLRMFANNLSKSIFKPSNVGVDSIIEELCLDLLEVFSLNTELHLSLVKGFSLFAELPLDLLEGLFSILSELSLYLT